jgi:hypothetical protein
MNEWGGTCRETGGVSELKDFNKEHGAYDAELTSMYQMITGIDKP